MKFAIVLVSMCLSTATAFAETYEYSCKVCIFPTIANGSGDGCDVDGKAYPLRIDDNKNVLEWRMKIYKLTVDSCGKYGWRAEGNGTSFMFCTATQGYGAIEDKDGNVRVRCSLKR
jgi:hypothetical protein